MRTNFKLVRTAIQLHILNSVYGYDHNLSSTFEDAAKRLASEFARVANFPANVKQHPNDQDRFMDYMRGLPFCFIYSNNGISEYLESIGCIPNPKYSDDTNRQKAETLYYYLIYVEMIKATK